MGDDVLVGGGMLVKGGHFDLHSEDKNGKWDA